MVVYFDSEILTCNNATGKFIKVFVQKSSEIIFLFSFIFCLNENIFMFFFFFFFCLFFRCTISAKEKIFCDFFTSLCDKIRSIRSLDGWMDG